MPSYFVVKRFVHTGCVALRCVQCVALTRSTWQDGSTAAIKTKYAKICSLLSDCGNIPYIYLFHSLCEKIKIRLL